MSLKARKPSCLDRLKKAHRAVLWCHEAIVAHPVLEDGGGPTKHCLDHHGASQKTNNVELVAGSGRPSMKTEEAQRDLAWWLSKEGQY